MRPSCSSRSSPWVWAASSSSCAAACGTDVLSGESAPVGTPAARSSLGRGRRFELSVCPARTSRDSRRDDASSTPGGVGGVRETAGCRGGDYVLVLVGRVESGLRDGVGKTSCYFLGMWGQFRLSDVRQEGLWLRTSIHARGGCWTAWARRSACGGVRRDSPLKQVTDRAGISRPTCG